MTNARPHSAMLAVAVLASAALLLSVASTAKAAPKAKLWDRWLPHAETATTVIDNSAWDLFLARYLKVGPDGINRIAYGEATPADRAALGDYLTRLGALDVAKLTQDQQFAFWVNLYNATTVKLVLDHYPLRSIRDIAISPGLFASGPWGAKILTVDGEKLSLDDIEHRILRPIWHDPRVHYAVNCAALGCPNLAPTAYEADRLEPMLEAAAQAYVNHPRGVHFERDRLIVSSLYDWYAADFKDGVLAHLKHYAAPELRARLERAAKIDGYSYDWALNDTAGPATNPRAATY